MSDSPDIEFNYDDSDSYDNEIAELYSYTEGPEFQLNLKAFEDVCSELGVVPLWQSLSNVGKKSLLIRLSDHLELCDRTIRMRAVRALLYIAQGCWGEVQSDREQNFWVRRNIYLMVKFGMWTSFLQLLHLEIDHAAASNEIAPKLAVSVSLANSSDLRVILSVMYTIVETIRVPVEDEEEKYAAMREAFRDDLALPQEGGELVALTLLGMVTRFCNSSAPHFPIRKVLLLLWKVLLFSLGGTETMRKLKNEYRSKVGLDVTWEDTLEVSRTMRASTPPASAADLIEQQNNQRKRPFRRSLAKQSSLDDSVGEFDLTADDDERPPIDPDEPPDLPQPPSPRPGTPVPCETKVCKGLPWIPKVRQKDIDAFLDSTRIKFVGYPLEGDRTSLAGLPQPIHEGVDVLSKHVYESLSEYQIRREEEITKNPMSQPEGEVPQTPTEIFYQVVLPTLPQCMIALLKILLAAAPTSKSKTDSINIMADVLPEEMPTSVVQSMKLGLDVNRHKEVLVKAVSAILLILLKHFKITHVYQFEFMSQHLVFANCIPLILKFFNQNIMAYVQAKNSIVLLDFPACVIGDPPEMTAESLEASTGGVPTGATIGGGESPTNSITGEATTSFCCWRNMFSCVNLLRILNKLCKWKHSRIMMLVVFKSAPILKRTLKVKHAMMQLYVLKLLKMQTKYLGRQWRKTNMKTLSAIYQKVRHRLNDDWAYGNDPDARPWDFQTEECALRACVDRFNNRRYNASSNKDPDFEPVDNCITSVLGRHVELTEEFKKHYEIWLQQEVLSTSIDWDQLVSHGL